MNGIELFHAVLGLLLTVACLGIGGRICAPFFGGGKGKDFALWLPVGAATGFAVLSFFGYLFHSVVRPSWSSVGLLCLVSIALGWPVWTEIIKSCRRIALPGRNGLEYALWILILAVVGLSLLKALTPPVEGDALQGYMFTGRWIAHEGLQYCPYNPRYSLMPAGTELFYAYGFGIGSDITVKMADFCFGLMMIVLVYGLARCIAPKYAALAAAVSLMILPDFQGNWGNGKVDVTASFVFLAALAVLLAQSAPLSVRDLALSSFLAGTACGQKYTFWILAPALVAAIWIGRHRDEKDNAAKFRLTVVCCAIIALCLIPHGVKNLLWTGNPVAPFAKDLIPSRNIHLGHRSDAIHTDSLGWMLFPLTVFFNGGKSPWLGPFPPLLLAALPLLFFRRRREWAGYMLTAGLLLAVWVIVRGEEWLVTRFLLAPIALLLAASAAAIAAAEVNRPWIRTALTAGTAGLLLYFGLWVHRDWRHHWKFVTGLESRAAWQARQAPQRGYPALHALGPRLGEGQRILIGASLYNLPENRLRWAGTEAELEKFQKTAPEYRERFLTDNGFTYFYDTARTGQEWAQHLQKAYVLAPTAGFELRIHCTAAAPECPPLIVDGK